MTASMPSPEARNEFQKTMQAQSVIEQSSG